MRMEAAMKIINKTPKYMVSFEWKEGGMLRSDYFPDKHAGEALIATEEEAWILAQKFADKTKGDAVNIYVVGSDFTPVDNYEERFIKNR